jgi:iron complex outermembrane receptor protein
VFLASLPETEIKPVEPDQDNACEGRMHTSFNKENANAARPHFSEKGHNHNSHHPGFRNKFYKMKLYYSMLFCICTTISFGQITKKFNDTTLLQPVEINAVRAQDNAPFAKTNIGKKEIEKLNLGQDLPFLLNQTPSVVVNSDAGTGVGYTGIRIRGTDATRINVTLNGIPYNDAESQGTFFVDLPDFSSSVNSIQIQRGVGTSSNGTGAFGATINLSTNEIKKDFYAEINNSLGSFNTVKNTFQFGSGLLGKHFTFDARLSKISGNGYIDRAKSDLKSFYTSAAYLDAGNSLRINIFSGKEKTYQAWNGIPENLLQTNRTYNGAGTEQPGLPYQNETDNYIQTHYQLFYNHKFSNEWKLNLAFFYTMGKGYYEQYKASQNFADYGLADYWNGSTNISKTDLIRRLWLDNKFYGSSFSFQHQRNGNQFIMGGGLNQYNGQHFGKIIWSQIKGAVPADYRWYNLTAYKSDFSLFTKWTQQWDKNWLSFFDVQFRNVNYTINGFRYNPTINVAKVNGFFNPKFGLTYTKNSWTGYASYSLAAHEPNRDDFEANQKDLPKPEILNDLEIGISKKKERYFLNAGLYYMLYKDQLVLTGKINDVGAYTRTNIANSYRAGIELQGKIIAAAWINLEANANFSSNKIKNFTEYLDDYDNGGQKSNFYAKTNISFSPAIVAGGSINFTPLKNAGLSLIGKYVGKQFLDNSSMSSRSLNAFYTQDVKLSYLLENKLFRSTDLIVQFNNVLNKKYEPNGYSFSYIYNRQLTTENYYFPMAGCNFMLGVNVKF